MTGGMTECAAKMQKAPTFSGRGWTVSGGFCVVLIYLLTHGPEAQAAGVLISMLGHKNAPSHGKCNSIIP